MDELKAAYDREESPSLEEHEPNTVASLLKQYLRDLPENLLTKELMPRFEEACGRATEAEKVQELQRLLRELPECNHLLLSWLIVHMDHVIAKELETKMNIQNISIVLSPTVQVRAVHMHSWYDRPGMGPVCPPPFGTGTGKLGNALLVSCKTVTLRGITNGPA